MVSDSVYQVVWLINTQIDYQSLLKYENRNVTTPGQRKNAVKLLFDGKKVD